MARSGWFDEPDDNEEQSLTVAKPLLPPQKPRPKNAPQPRNRRALPEDSMIVDPEFLTVAEFAQLAGLKPGEIYRKIHGGQLRAAQFRGTFRIPKDAADEALRKMNQGDNPEVGPS